MTRNTAVVVASSPGFPHGVVDDVAGIAKVSNAKRCCCLRCMGPVHPCVFDPFMWGLCPYPHPHVNLDSPPEQAVSGAAAPMVFVAVCLQSVTLATTHLFGNNPPSSSRHHAQL